MSAPLLRYPYKPPEVSDDMESFIYVMFFCVLRFQRTSLTKDGFLALKPGANFNESLAVFISNFFFQGYKIDGLSYGGAGKFAAYANSTDRPPFTMLDETSALGQLMSALHTICFRHFQSIDESALEKYDPAIRGQREGSSKSDYPAAPRTANDWTLVRQVPPGRNKSLLKEKPTIVRRPDPLTDHRDLYGALFDILNDKTVWWDREKTPDQFEGLPGLEFIHGRAESSDVSQRFAARRRTEGSGR